MLDKQSLLKSVTQPEERLLLAKVLDQAIFSLKKHENTFSDFLDPSKLALALKALSGVRELNLLSFGGHEECERRMIGFCPDYRELSESDFPIEALKIQGDTRFSRELTHRDFLGSVLGLGIERNKIGDIFVFEDCAYLFAAADIISFIDGNLERIGRTSVKTARLALNAVQLPQPKTEEKFTTVSSLRLDALVGAAFNMSRGKAQGLISGEKVFVNWLVTTSGSKTVNEGDLISVRGFGRAKIQAIDGKTKKDRIRVTFLKYV